jgi:hypothetical protein
VLWYYLAMTPALAAAVYFGVLAVGTYTWFGMLEGAPKFYRFVASFIAGGALADAVKRFLL